MPTHLALEHNYQKGVFDFNGKKSMVIVFPKPFKAGTVPAFILTPENGEVMRLIKPIITNKKAEIQYGLVSTLKGIWAAVGEM